jgi:hypothetical protein
MIDVSILTAPSLSSLLWRHDEYDDDAAAGDDDD